MKLHWQMHYRHRRPAGSSALGWRVGSPKGSREDGYVLLTLLLLAMVLAFTLVTILPSTVFELKRDREGEMVHRGVQYTRAIQAYYRKFGRYPTRLEDLENTNNLRFLRKRYKDPENKNQEFKLLHFGEVKLSLSGGIGGGTIPGASPAGSPGGLNGSGPGSSAFGGSAFGGSGSGGSAFGNSGPGGSAFGSGSGVNSSGVFSQSSSGGNSNSGFGTGSSSQTLPGQPGTNPTSGSDPSQTSSQNPGTPGSGSSSGQIIAGGPIIGVASTSSSKDPSIREYNHKRKYSEWQFVYDPAADRGGLITTPYQPSLPAIGGLLPGQPGQPGTSSSSPFGSSPTGTNTNSFTNSNPSSPAASPQPANPPQQQ